MILPCARGLFPPCDTRGTLIVSGIPRGRPIAARTPRGPSGASAGTMVGGLHAPSRNSVADTSHAELASPRGWYLLWMSFLRPVTSHGNLRVPWMTREEFALLPGPRCHGHACRPARGLHISMPIPAPNWPASIPVRSRSSPALCRVGCRTAVRPRQDCHPAKYHDDIRQTREERLIWAFLLNSTVLVCLLGACGNADPSAGQGRLGVQRGYAATLYPRRGWFPTFSEPPVSRWWWVLGLSRVRSLCCISPPHAQRLAAPVSPNGRPDARIRTGACTVACGAPVLVRDLSSACPEPGADGGASHSFADHHVLVQPCGDHVQARRV